VIVTDLGQQPSPERDPESGDAADDPPVRVGLERGVDQGLRSLRAAEIASSWPTSPRSIVPMACSAVAG
jgi:hypothetical protein